MPIAKINGIAINYSIEGQGDPLIMIMGLGASQSLWKPQVTFFRKHYQVITFDNRGTGKSEKPDGPYTLEIMVDDTIKLMDYLGITRAHVLGTSMGGMIAQEIALQYPRRVFKLILASTFACRDKAPSGVTPEMVQLAKRSPSKLGISFINLAYNKPFYKYVIVLKIMIRSILVKHSSKTTGKDDLLRQIRASPRFDTTDNLHLIEIPTLVITGSKDRVIKPASSEVIAKLIPNSKLVIIKNGSHFLHVEMKKAFNQEVLNFLMQR